jgi:alpha-glucosidase
VDAFFPDDLFYDWYTGVALRGRGEVVTLTNISYTDIPLHVRGGSIIPVRARSASTTTELRKQPFRLIVAPGLDGRAEGELYLDDGESLHQPATLEVTFTYESGRLSLDGQFTLSTDLKIESVTILGKQEVQPVAVNLSLTRPGSIDLGQPIRITRHAPSQP